MTSGLIGTGRAGPGPPGPAGGGADPEGNEFLHSAPEENAHRLGLSSENLQTGPDCGQVSAQDADMFAAGPHVPR